MPRGKRKAAQWVASTTGCARCGCAETRDTAQPHRPLIADGIHVYCRSCLRQMTERLLLMAERQKQIEARLRRVYSLTFAEYGQLFDQQRGVCAICRDRGTALQPYDKPVGLVVDHDHDDGHVRGLLCSRCNSGIGLLGDEPQNLDAAAEYLRQRKAKREAS